jgi:cell division septation protein DedD/nucleoid DNA-binding protein
MEELIIKLLKDSGRVIVPDFGAFIIKTKSPLKAIFNEFLQYNDGALIGALAKEKKIERDEAATQIKEYVKQLNSKLDNGEAVLFEGVGQLSKSATGKITLGEANVTPQQPSAPIKETKSEVEFDLSEKTEAKEIKKEEDKITAPPKRDITKPEDKKKPETVKPTPPPVNINKKVEDTTLPADKTKEEPTPLAEYYDDDNSGNKMNIILWIIIIVVVNGAIVGYFLFDDEIKGLFGKKKPTLEEQVIDTPTITEEEEIPSEATVTSEEEIIIEEQPTPETGQETELVSGTKYYVVAGVFREESNANNLVTELRNKGYNAEKFGKIGALHAVSYDVFPTKQEADNFMLKIKKEVDSETWIRIVD